NLDLALRDYADFSRFRHPAPSDLVNAIRGRLGEAAARNLERALFDRGTVDYLARDVQSAAADPHAGVYDAASGRQTIPRSETRPATRFVGHAIVLRHGTLELPVSIELRFEDGHTERQSWNGEGTSYHVRCEGTSRLVGVTVDPDQRVLLDDNLTNNAASADNQGAPRTLERLLYAAQLLLGGGLP